MGEHCDILIVGAGTAGTYFGWQMAKRGRSVVIVERNERQGVGKRLDVFHVDSVKFAEFDIPPPEEGSPEFCVILEKGISYSPEGKHPKTVRYPFHVMRLPFFLQRLFALAESEGVRLEFSTAFSRLLHEEGRGRGAVVARGDGEETIRARLVVDASGINAVVRTAFSVSKRWCAVRMHENVADAKFTADVIATSRHANCAIRRCPAGTLKSVPSSPVTAAPARRHSPAAGSSIQSAELTYRFVRSASPPKL